MDYFDLLPDDILLNITGFVSDDINTVFRLRAVSQRFNSLVIMKTKHLFLQANKFDKIFNTDLRSYHSYHSLEPTTNFPNRNVFVRCVNHVTKIVIELPADYTDYMNPLPKHEMKCMYKASFGKNLKNSCAILCYSTECYYQPKMMSPCFRYMWRKISVMHLLLKKCASIAMNVVPHLENLVSLVVKDREGDLEMVMDEGETRDYREMYHDARADVPEARFTNRVRLNMDEFINIEAGLGPGTLFWGLVTGPYSKKIDDAEEVGLIRRAFGSGLHGMAIEKLLHKSYSLYFRSFVVQKL